MANSFFGGKVHNIHIYDHVLNEYEIVSRTEKMKIKFDVWDVILVIVIIMVILLIISGLIQR